MGHANVVRQRWCEDHRLPFLGRCPFCAEGLEPVRYMLARRDFAGVPVAGTADVLPHMRTVDLADVVRTCGLQLAEIERLKRELLKPLEDAQRRIYKDMRETRLDVDVFKRAVRVYLGLHGSDHFMDDPAVAACVACLRAPPSAE